MKRAFSWPWVIVVLLLWLSALGTAAAANLSELQAMAVAHRKSLENRRLAVENRALTTEIARSPFYPSVDFAYTVNQLDAANQNETRENSRFTGVVAYNLFDGFQDRYQLAAAEYFEQYQRYLLESAVQDIALSVALQYLQVYRQNQSLAVTEERLQLLKKQVQDNRKRYEVGLIKRNDLLKIEVEFDDARQEVAATRAAHQKAQLELQRLVEAPFDSDRLIFKDLAALPKAEPVENYLQRMQSQRSELLALEQLRMGREKEVAVAEGAYFPAVDVAASYSRFGDDHLLDDRPGDDDELRAQLNVTYNLFDGHEKKYRRAQAALAVRQVKNDLHELERRYTTNVKRLLLDFEVGLANLSVAESGIQQAEESVRITDVAYRQGVDSATDLLAAILALSRAKNNRINARIDVFASHFAISRAIGDFKIPLPQHRK